MEIPSFRLALNASTIRNDQLGVMEQIKVAAEAGYTGIELWVPDICDYLENGGKQAELRRLAEASGVCLVNAIAFFKWTDADPTVRLQGMEQAKREIQLLREIGCTAVAAPPFGDVSSLTLDDIAENFRALAEIGREAGVEPYLEIWGMAAKISTLSQAAYVVLQSGVSDAKLLVDVYHLYKGGSRHDGIRMLNGDSIGIVHINDYPASPPRDRIGDSDRCYPGDGVAPVAAFLNDLWHIGYRGFLSLELFRKDYGVLGALNIAKRGLEKIQSIRQDGTCT